MAKKNSNSSAVTRLTAEELGKLTPKELVEYAAKLTEEAAALESDNEAKSKELKSLSAKSKAEKPVSFEVESEDGKETLVYDFTAPALTWDDNQVYNIRKLSESKEKADVQLFEEMCAKLVQRSSGLVALRKED